MSASVEAEARACALNLFMTVDKAAERERERDYAGRGKSFGTQCTITKRLFADTGKRGKNKIAAVPLSTSPP